MELFNNINKYRYGITEVEGKPMISSVKVSSLFGTRHSNTMRSIETAMKYIPDSPEDYKKTTCRMNGHIYPAYMISRRVFEWVTKRLDNKVLRGDIILEFTGHPYTEEKNEPKPETIPAKATAPAPDIKSRYDILMERIDQLETKLARLAAIEEKLDFIISNSTKSGRAMVITPETTPVKISNEPISVSELAKMLNQSGINIGEMRLFQWLRDKQFLCAFGSEYNLPRQKYIEQGLFIIKSTRVQLPTGQCVEKNTTKVTAKGQEYFINKFVYESAQIR